MMDKLIQWSVNNRFLVTGAALVFFLFGIMSAPRCLLTCSDLTAPTVAVLTEAPDFPVGSGKSGHLPWRQP